MNWIAENESLTLPGTGIEIRLAEHPGIPFTLHSPIHNPMAYWTLNSAKAAGEHLAQEAANFFAN